MYPEEYYYTRNHEWVHVQGNTGIVGITDFAQTQLGDVVYVELPKIGTHLKSHQSIGVIESVKAVADVYSPVSGEVIEVNEDLIDSPELVNQDPHQKGWIMKIKIADEEELQKLMTAAEYEKFIEGSE
ncbi:MAG: glycine cleavage system protein GcvH [Candidatus Aminicenantia bacterium]